MIVLVLDEEEGRQMLTRLLPSQVPQQRGCTCQQIREPSAAECAEDRPTQSWRPWTPEEDAPLIGCAAPLQARKAYRRVFPQSRRTNAAIKARYLALKKNRKLAQASDAIAADLQDECSAEQIEDEIEATGEPAGPVDSEIAAEMEEDAPALCECTGEEVTLCEEPRPSSKRVYGDAAALDIDMMDGALCDAPLSSPEPEKETAPPSPSGKGPWTDVEREAIYLADSSPAAWAAYHEALPSSARPESSVKAMWSCLRKKGWKPPVKETQVEEDKPLPLHTRVRLLLPGTRYCGCEGEIVRQTSHPDEYVVVPDGACARFVVTREDLEVL